MKFLDCFHRLCTVELLHLTGFSTDLCPNFEPNGCWETKVISPRWCRDKGIVYSSSKTMILIGEWLLILILWKVLRERRLVHCCICIEVKLNSDAEKLHSSFSRRMFMFFFLCRCRILFSNKMIFPIKRWSLWKLCLCSSWIRFSYKFFVLRSKVPVDILSMKINYPHTLLHVR